MAAWRKILGLTPAAGSSADKDKEKNSDGPDRNLSVKAVVGTRLVQVLYDSPDPKFAADYVNTLADEFIGQNVEVRYQASQRTGEWLNCQLDDMKIRLERNEDQLQRYARSTGL